MASYRNHPPVLEPEHSIAQEQPREAEESQNLVWGGENIRGPLASPAGFPGWLLHSSLTLLPLQTPTWVTSPQVRTELRVSLEETVCKLLQILSPRPYLGLSEGGAHFGAL